MLISKKNLIELLCSNNLKVAAVDRLYIFFFRGRKTE